MNAASVSAAEWERCGTSPPSETLKARARAIRDEIAQVAAALSGCVGRDTDDFAAQLATGLLLATWSVALIQAHRAFRRKRDAGEARAVFLAIVDRGRSASERRWRTRPTRELAVLRGHGARSVTASEAQGAG